MNQAFIQVLNLDPLDLLLCQEELRILQLILIMRTNGMLEKESFFCYRLPNSNVLGDKFWYQYKTTSYIPSVFIVT